MTASESPSGVEDDLAEFRDEWQAVVSKVIARAWTDNEFKALLIKDSTAILHAEGLFFPEKYVVEFYDDPGAQCGDWYSIGRGSRAVHRFPIPVAPSLDAVRADDLGSFDGASLACCCPCASCTGAVSHETWF